MIRELDGRIQHGVLLLRVARVRIPIIDGLDTHSSTMNIFRKTSTLNISSKSNWGNTMSSRPAVPSDLKNYARHIHDLVLFTLLPLCSFSKSRPTRRNVIEVRLEPYHVFCASLSPLTNSTQHDTTQQDRYKYHLQFSLILEFHSTTFFLECLSKKVNEEKHVFLNSMKMISCSSLRCARIPFPW